MRELREESGVDGEREIDFLQQSFGIKGPAIGLFSQPSNSMVPALVYIDEIKEDTKAISCRYFVGLLRRKTKEVELKPEDLGEISLAEFFSVSKAKKILRKSRIKVLDIALELAMKNFVLKN